MSNNTLHVKLQCNSEPQTHENTMMPVTIDIATVQWSYSAMELHGDETKAHRLCLQLGTR